MKTTITLSVDVEKKDRVMKLVQSQGLSLSWLFNQYLEKFLEEQQAKNGRNE